MFVVIVNTPGYLPGEDDPGVFDTLEDAKTYLKDEVERHIDHLCELAEDDTPEDEIYSAWWAEDLTEAYVSDPSRSHDLGRNFSIDEITEGES